MRLAEQGGPVVARVVVVSNRVGIPNRDGGARAGGLEVVLRSFLKRNQGVWFGWSGRTVPKGEEVVREVEHSGVTYITTDISRGDFQEFYNGFANRMLWPILHYRLDLVEFSSRDMAGYLRVNEMFADRLQAFLQARRRDLGARLSLPAARQGAARARRREQDRLLPAHPVPAARSAHRAAQARAHHPQPLPLRSRRIPDRQRRRQSGGLSHRRMRGCRAATAAPSSPASGRCGSACSRSASRWRSSSGSPGAPASSPPCARWCRSLADRSMIIGVDRLDYSKGIGMRMRAFEQFLDQLSALARRRDLSADHAAQPLRHPRICRHGAADRRDRRPRQRPLRRGRLDADPLRQPLAQPHRARRPVPLVARGAGDAAARRHESRRQGICRGAGPGGSGRADPVALCRRRGGMPVGAAGQSLRPGGGGRGHRSGAVDAAGRAQGPPRQHGQGAVGERHQALGHALHRGADEPAPVRAPCRKRPAPAPTSPPPNDRRAARPASPRASG